MNVGSEVDVDSTEYCIYKTYVLSNLINGENDDDEHIDKNVKQIETINKTFSSHSQNMQPYDMTTTPLATADTREAITTNRELIGPTDVVDVEDTISTRTQNTLLSNNRSLESFHSSHSDIIWVPADKHPEIAPDEFSNFIQTMGANATRRRSSSLHRKKSILSHSLSSSSSSSPTDTEPKEDYIEEARTEDEPELEQEDKPIERTLSEKKRHFLQKVLKGETHQGEMTDGTSSKSTHAFDRNSTPIDNSRIIALRADRSLLRRSAFSARGRSRRSVTNESGAVDGEDTGSTSKFHRRSLSQREVAVESSPDEDNTFASLPDFTRSNSIASSSASHFTTDTAAIGSNTWDQVHGITLTDNSIRKADYIDMGSELETSALPMLSRVQEAESQVLSSSPSIVPQQQIVAGELDTNYINDSNDEVLPPAVEVSKPSDKQAAILEDEAQIAKESDQGSSTDDDGEEEEPQATLSSAEEEKMPVTMDTNTTTAVVPSVITPEESVMKVKRPAMVRSDSDIATTINATSTSATKTAKRSSWFSGLFTSNASDKKASSVSKKGKEKARKSAPTATTVTTVNNSPSIAASAISGFASIFTRSSSAKSSVSTTSDPTVTNSDAVKLKSKHKPGSENQKKKKKRASNNSYTKNNTANDDNNKPEFPMPPNNVATSPTSLLFNSNRMPLQVERAIYRLSHFKLTDVRRPLCQQVLISNLMFWYLSIQQNDFSNQTASSAASMASPSIPERQHQQPIAPNNIPSQHPPSAKKSSSKMSKFINSAKKRRNEMAQFVQNYPVMGVENKTTAQRKSNVQFSLPTLPPHYARTNTNPSVKHDATEEEEEDDVPLSHYKS